MDRLSRPLIALGLYTWMLRWGVVALMLAMTAVPIAAMLRIRFSRGRRGGMPLAAAGLAIALLWWLLLMAVRFTWRGFGAAGG
jgi:hypothetical protein